MRKAGKEQLGVRAFGDCNAVLREVMRQLLTNKDRVEWERGQDGKTEKLLQSQMMMMRRVFLKISNPNPSDCDQHTPTRH